MLLTQTSEGDRPSALRQLLFRDSLTLSPGEVIAWWERRRLAYNVAVGGTGLITLTAMMVITRIGPNARPWPFPALIAIFAYGAFVNVMYTSGWLLELSLRSAFGQRAGTVGATLFRYGLAFSVGVTTLPIFVSVVGLFARIAGLGH